jgi:hypothetical protein
MKWSGLCSGLDTRQSCGETGRREMMLACLPDIDPMQPNNRSFGMHSIASPLRGLTCIFKIIERLLESELDEMEFLFSSLL